LKILNPNPKEDAMKGKDSAAIMLGLFALAVIGCSGEQTVEYYHRLGEKDQCRFRGV
jgi:hypothetical protein